MGALVQQQNPSPHKMEAGRGIVNSEASPFCDDLDTCVTNCPEGAPAEAGAGNKPDAAEDGKGEPAGAAKNKKLVKVPVKIQYIRALEPRPPIPPRYPRGLPEDLIQLPPESETEQALRDSLAEIAVDLKSDYDKKMAILH